MLIAVDPGLRHLGCAVGTNPGRLLTAFLVTSPDMQTLWAPAWLAVAQELERQLRRRLPALPDATTPQLVFEAQEVYQPKRRKREDAEERKGPNPNDLLQLAGVNGALAYLFGRWPQAVYLPRKWKGSAKKDAHHAALLARLDAEERATIEACAAGKRHNVLDAVGLLKYHAAVCDGSASLHPNLAGRLRPAVTRHTPR